MCGREKETKLGKRDRWNIKEKEGLIRKSIEEEKDRMREGWKESKK